MSCFEFQIVDGCFVHARGKGTFDVGSWSHVYGPDGSRSALAEAYLYRTHVELFLFGIRVRYAHFVLVLCRAVAHARMLND